MIDKKFGSAVARQARVEEAVTVAMKNPRARPRGLAAIRKSAKKVVKTVGKRTFEVIRDRYLMLKDFPEQRGRYSLRYEDCVPADRLQRKDRGSA
ncbi:MAG: hypothetical protein ABI625_18430 [bacterium]